MRRFTLGLGTAIAALAVAPGASAATLVQVNAQANSSSGGTGALTGLIMGVGQQFTVSVNPNDLWNAGDLPRWSNANGLTGNLLATGTDDSGQSAGTLIGQNFGLHTSNGLSAPYGSLVGSIGGVYKLLGTNFSGQSWGAGELLLYYWDSNSGDNSQFVTASVAAVPEPSTWALMIAGFGIVGMAMRRRSARTPRVSFKFA